jgi:predicted enzyme related to lactoylglutathione lyase
VTEPVAKMIAITIDANDAPSVAAFWAGLTATEVTKVEEDGAFHFLGAVGDAPELCIQRVPEPKVGKARVHVDFSAPDLQAITDRILALGGTWDGEERTFSEYTWRMFQDPEGTEFDVVLE